ncbi:hypothetical protein COO60DRAFT_520198 [Scenedesmus sp. NREL 46B-D3]|nr:hypothetical protein COO60DRAFT_520198 [Scenedesmus sp. NREL 46B-D3]
MKPQSTNLVVNTGKESPCSQRYYTGLLQGSCCSSPDCWEQGSSCSSASSQCSSNASWQLGAAPSNQQHQPDTSMYSKLRVLVPGAVNNCTAGSSPAEDSSPGACSASLSSDSCPSTPGRCALLAEPALLVGNSHLIAGQQGAYSADEQQGGCLSSSAARRLLACNGTSSADVSNWLNQQISLRQCERAPISNIDAPGAPEIAGFEVLGAAAGGCRNSRGLPLPAFQLLGLL